MKRNVLLSCLFIALIALFTADITLYAEWQQKSTTPKTDYKSAFIGVLKYVPSGVFQYDSEESDVCTISAAFHNSKYDITRAEWTAVTGLADPSTGGRSVNCPVDTVNWYLAIYSVTI